MGLDGANAIASCHTIRYEVVLVNLAEHTLAEQIEMVRSAWGVVGMHGAAMSSVTLIFIFVRRLYKSAALLSSRATKGLHWSAAGRPSQRLLWSVGTRSPLLWGRVEQCCAGQHRHLSLIHI